jgi:hypothetical protein
MLDVSEKKTEINQLYHPTGNFEQDSQDIIYSKDNINKSKFAHIAIKEWFYLVKENGYIIIDYQPNKIVDFKKLEKLFWWLWKQKYEIIYHGTLSPDDLKNITGNKLNKYIQNLQKYYQTDLDPRTLLPKPRPTQTHPDTQNGYLRFIAKKTKSTLIPGDNINKWTFGIITNGQRMDWMEEILESIHAQKIPEYEIIVCGTYHDQKKDNFTYIPFNQRDDLGWITRKKNLIIQKAKYENLCIIHDRAIFPKNWFTEMKKYGNCFEIMCNRQFYQGMRAYDWTTLGGPDGTQYKMLLLDYRDWDWWSVIGGMQIISKKSILQKVPLDETRHWNGFEDSELTFNLRDAGYIARINQAEIKTLGFRHGLIPGKPFNKKFYWPDMLTRRIIRTIAYYTTNIPYLHKQLESFTKTEVYKKIIKLKA